MLAARSLGCCSSRITPLPALQHVPTRMLVTTRANNKSWGDIGAEVAQVAKDVVGKIKDTATTAIETLTGSKQQDKAAGRLTREQQQQQQRGRAPLYRPEDDRQLPQFPSPGGLFGGLVGGLVNQAVKGLASEMQKTAAQTRSVSETAALRIQNSSILQQRLGRVTVGPAMGQSMSSSNINGRVSKNISLLLPVYGPGGRPVAQAQVSQVEAGGRVESCVIVVRMPEGDTVVLNDDDDDQPLPGGGSTSSSGQQYGEVVDAEFRDLK